MSYSYFSVLLLQTLALSIRPSPIVHLGAQSDSSVFLSLRSSGLWGSTGIRAASPLLNVSNLLDTSLFSECWFLFSFYVHDSICFLWYRRLFSTLQWFCLRFLTFVCSLPAVLFFICVFFLCWSSVHFYFTHHFLHIHPDQCHGTAVIWRPTYVRLSGGSHHRQAIWNILSAFCLLLDTCLWLWILWGPCILKTCQSFFRV